MKIQYFASITLISLLSLGTITSCSQSTITPDTSAEIKTNPSAPIASPVTTTSKLASGGLAADLQGKPVVVDIYASWCPACKNVAPALATLKQEYAGKATFVALDVSDKASTTKATETAKKLGLDKFFAENKSETGTIAILDPATAKALIKEQNNADVATYKKSLDSFIAKVK
jgi:thiol-disulfide isomerase/thioredoxin